ncbi:MAG: S41 family peptidase [Muribaculaceae bacterium]|nr:S41 family peptidase [Muribaculaceae bacterium]
MKRTIIPALIACAAASASASEAPLWLRDVAISPDGATVAFTYRGDIFTVPVSGGQAKQITSHKAYDSKPVWTPDGSRIAFRSNREGTDDIYIVNATGGTATRLTTSSGVETPIAFLNEKQLLFSESGMPGRTTAQAPFLGQTYTIDVTRPGTRPSLYISLPIGAADVNADGRMLYHDRKGFEDPLRKHERSSATSDIWLYDNGKFTQLTTFNGHDINPVWSPNADEFYFVSEEDGTLNVYARSIDGKSKRQLTKFTKHPVRSLSASRKGTLAFSWDGEIYTLAPGAAEPTKLNVSVVTDDYDSDLIKALRNYGATDMAVSPSGEEVAFVIRGEIYVTSVKYKTTKRITDTPDQERCLSFSPDGRTLVYDSDRNGKWQLFTTTIKNPAEKNFTYATELVEEPLYSCATTAQQPEFSPDGKKVAFLENRTELRVIDLKSKEVNTALDGKYNYSYTDGDVSYTWSPDSKWFLVDYIGTGGWNNTDIALAKADGTEVIDLTESGYSDSNPKWVLGGKGLVYSTGKYGMKAHGSWGNQLDAVLMVLDSEAWDDFNMTEEEAALKEKESKDSSDKAEDKKADDKKKDKKGKKNDKASDKDKEPAVKPLEFDLANRRYRMARLTPSSSSMGDFYLSPKGDKFYYVASATEGGANLMCRDLKKGDTKVLAKGISGGLVPDKKGENLFLISWNGMKKINLANGSTENIEFEAPYDRHPSLEREYMYNHMLSQVKDKFYDANLHGVDWDGYGEHYRKFLPHINNNRDFANLLSEILGELNASHTGGRAGSFYNDYSGQFMSVASLGAYYDPEYKGEGLKVTEVLARGPLATKKADVKPGDIIMAIDGVTIAPEADYNSLLEGKAGRRVRLNVQKADGTTKEVTVKPISAGTQSSLLYQRWVERNEAIVDSISGGRIGYVHVQGMNTPSFQTVYDRLLGKYRNCDAVVVDTRYNGGGWLHNDIALLLNGKEYVRFMPRGQYIGSEPFSQWTKPSAMLVNESNYSDAHGTPFVYQTLGIGDVVGAPIPGTMTAVWWENQIDSDIVFGIPQVTSVDMQGNVLENHQLNPDVLIINQPGDVVAGRDAQLEGAVKHLMNKVAKK